MLDFRPGSNAPHYLGRAYQRRMLYLVGGVILVVLLISLARNPYNYWWFYKTTEKPEPPIDTRVPRETKPEPVAGAFTSRPKLKRKAVRFDPDVPFHQRVRPDLLKPAKKSDRQRFSIEEREAFAHLIEILQQTDQATIRQGPAERVSYVQIFSQSTEYCGRLVTLSGRAQGMRVERVSRDDYGIDQYYQVWLQHGGRNNNPIVICCLELPEGFPEGMRIDEPVEITGFYYRRWWYTDSSNPPQPRIAPMILAKTVDWQPVTEAESPFSLPFSLPVLIGMVVAAGAIALVAVLYLFNRAGGDRVPDYVRRHMKGAEPGGLDDVGPAPGVNERLEGLERADRNGEPPPGD